MVQLTVSQATVCAVIGPMRPMFVGTSPHFGQSIEPACLERSVTYLKHLQVTAVHGVQSRQRTQKLLDQDFIVVLSGSHSCIINLKCALNLQLRTVCELKVTIKRIDFSNKLFYNFKIPLGITEDLVNCSGSYSEDESYF